MLLGTKGLWGQKNAKLIIFGLQRLYQQPQTEKHAIYLYRVVWERYRASDVTLKIGLRVCTLNWTANRYGL